MSHAEEDEQERKARYPSGAAEAAPIPSFLPTSGESDASVLDRLAPTQRPPDAPSPSAPDPAPVTDGDGPSAAEQPSARSSTPESAALERDPELARPSLLAATEAASSRPPGGGLMATILAREARGSSAAVASVDDGALAALRTLPQRRRPRPDVAAADAELARSELLLQLASGASGATRARLLSSAAELLTRSAQPERAGQARIDAHAADPSDPVALRERRVAATRTGQHAEAQRLLAAELELPLGPAERALLYCAEAEVAAANGGDDAQLLESLRAAAELDHGATLANLACARLELRGQRLQPAAVALTRAASAIGDDRLRATLLVEAGRLFERAAEPSAARDAHAQALATYPRPAAALGLYRAERARVPANDAIAPALAALESLEALSPDPRFQNEVARKRASLTRQALHDPAGGLSALANAEGAPALREKLRCAEASGDVTAQRSALEGWAASAVGAERGLALCELALLLGRTRPIGTDDAPAALEAAHVALREAAIANAPQSLLSLARETLPRDSLAATEPAELPADDATDALRTAAQLAAERGTGTLERAALRRIPETDPAHVLADILSFDAAAEQFDLSAVQASLLRELERTPPAQQTGPALALLALAPPSEPQAASVARELTRALRGQPLVSRFVAARSPAEDAARLWLEEAEASTGKQAAFAAVMAGHLLHAAGRDEIDAYADALDRVRGYPPACFALEIPARQHADLHALERVHRELATTSEAIAERCARRARLGLLGAESDVHDAIAWFELAGEQRSSDPLLSDLLIRLGADDPARERVDRILSAAAREATPSFARAQRLRASAALEAEGRWGESSQIYRSLLAESVALAKSDEANPSDSDVPVRAGSERDALAIEGLIQALRRGGRWDALRAVLELRVAAREGTSGQAGALEALAELELRHGDTGRAKAALQRLFEHRPRAIAAARGLMRLAMLEHDDAELLWLSEHMLRWLETDAERAGELRLSLRLHALLGHSLPEPLLLASEGKLDAVLWYALLVEHAAVRRNDSVHYYEATARLAHSLPDPFERASYALRAAETLEITAPERAITELEPALLSAPDHPLALATAARLHLAASQPLAAAEAFARAAESARGLGRKAELFYAAGVLFDDELNDSERAVLALAQVSEIDVTYGDTFERLRRLLRERGAGRELLALLERRLDSEPPQLIAAELESERASLYLELGDRDSAKSALRTSLTHDPRRTDSLRKLADVLWDDGEHHKAAEVLVQLARLLEDDKIALGEVVFQLGSLYDDHLRDSRRAELAFTRAASLSPDDPRPVERLIEIWRKTGERDRAVRALQHLITNSWSAQTKEAYILQLAQTLEEMNEVALAEQSLEDARRKAPTSMRVLRAQSALYARESDQTALALHLQRSCNAMRNAIDEDPSEPTHWLHLIELLGQRDRADGAALVLDAAHSCGVELGLEKGHAVVGLGADALREGVLRKLVTRGLLDPLRRLLREFNRELAEFLPSHIEVTGPLPELQTRAIKGVENLFGLTELRLVGTEEPVCLPITTDPLCVCIGEDLYITASEAERFFLLARAVVVAKHGLILLVRSAPEQLLLVLHALRTVVKPGSAVQVANEREQRQVTRELAARLPQPRHTQLRPLLSDLMSSEDLSTRRLSAAAFEFGSRVALAVTGNLPAAVDALLRLRGKAPEEVAPEERAHLLRADPALRALLSFAISEAYLEGRREVLVAAPKESR